MLQRRSAQLDGAANPAVRRLLASLHAEASHEIDEKIAGGVASVSPAQIQQAEGVLYTLRKELALGNSAKVCCCLTDCADVIFERSDHHRDTDIM